MFCPYCRSQVNPEANVCNSCGKALQTQYQQSQYQQPQYQQPQHPMKWFKFLIYFALFAGAILNFATGVKCFTGSIYNQDGYELADLVYSAIDGLEPIDKFYGIALIALAVFQIVTRFQLAGFKKSAPKMVTLLYAIAVIISITYIACVSFVTMDMGIDLELSTFGANVAVSVAMCIANASYFNKRKSLFIN